MRRQGRPPDPARTYRRRPGAYGLITDGRRILLALNESVGEEIVFPGGGVDPGETPTRALHRETMEETGWRIHILRRLGAYQRHTFMPEYGIWAHKICHIYLCRSGRRVAAPIEPDHQPIWVDPAAAVEIMSLDAERRFLTVL